MHDERPNHTLQPSALVNEAYIRLVRGTSQDWKNRAHFFGVAAQAMWHVLTDYARRRLAGKRGAGVAPVAINEAFVIAPDRLEELLALKEALRHLGEVDARALQVVVLRIYAGRSIEEIAEVLQTSRRTVKRDWQYGQAWLKAELNPEKPNAASESDRIRKSSLTPWNFRPRSAAGSWIRHVAATTCCALKSNGCSPQCTSAVASWTPRRPAHI